MAGKWGGRGGNQATHTEGTIMDTPLIRLADYRRIDLGNRDGCLAIGKGETGQCYLILEADTYANPPDFAGLGSVEYRLISELLYTTIAKEMG